MISISDEALAGRCASNHVAFGPTIAGKRELAIWHIHICKGSCPVTLNTMSIFEGSHRIPHAEYYTKLVMKSPRKYDASRR